MSTPSSHDRVTRDTSVPISRPETALYLSHYFEQACDQQPDATAVLCGAVRLTYRELDRQANRAAHLLRKKGVQQGTAVGVLLERSPEMYVVLLAVLKVGAVFVPLDPAFPSERIAFIIQDAKLHTLVTTTALHTKNGRLLCQILEFDRATEELAGESETRLALTGDASCCCYVIYTSGSTGQPKGVAISQASITNYFHVVAPILRVTQQDHVYQGATITFDASFEEIWLTWLAGAMLVAGPTNSRRLGHELAEFLIEHEITVLFCVPTLLATLDCDVPTLRLIDVGGEACPAHLVRQWARPGRRFVNSYGPTETTIAATCCDLSPDRPVTIGFPLPTYDVFLLDDHLCPVEHGKPGEICIAGPGVASGYLNCPELTRERFIPNPFKGKEDGASCLYRTGDLGRLTCAGEIEYLGRLDMQVKVRGYRIELGEIEAVLCEDQAVAQACVLPMKTDGVVQDLAAYITLRASEQAAPASELLERLRAILLARLPAYMFPAFIEILESFPLMVSGKVDRARLPRPSSPRFNAQSRGYVPPASELEKRVAALWGQVLGCEKVSCMDDFFRDLGGHSLVAARVISLLRQEPAWQTLALGDLYRHSTIRQLAHFIETQITHDTERQTAHEGPGTAQGYTRRGVFFCGMVQLAMFYVLVLVGSLSMLVPESLTSLWGLMFLVASMAIWLNVLRSLLPIVVGRLLMKGIRPGKYPLWGWVYLRCWLYSKLLKASPLNSLTGSPLYSLYFRLLGARVGSSCHFASPLLDLAPFIHLEGDVSIGYGARLEPAIVENGWLWIAPIYLGRGVFLGANCVVRSGATIGDHSTIVEQSLLVKNQIIPAGECWGGSPLERMEVPPPVLAELAAKADGRPWPLAVYLGFIVGSAFFTFLPWLIAAPGLFLVVGATLWVGPLWGMASSVLVGPLFVLVTCMVVIFGKRSVLSGPHPGIYPIRSWFGLRKWLSDQLMNVSLNFTNTLYGTLYVIPFLRLLGATIGPWCEVSTVSYIDPDMLTLVGESFVADIAVVGAAVFHYGCVVLAPSVVGQRSFIGNGALVSGSSRLDDNSLVGVHSMTSTRHIASETAWLGSPAILLPRRQASDQFDEALTYHPRPGQVIERLLIEYFRVTLPATILALVLFGTTYALLTLSTWLAPLLLLLLTPVLLALGSVTAMFLVVGLKWVLIGSYRPRIEPLWSSFVRRSELITGLYEGIAVPILLSELTGTPWIGPFLRLLGTHIGQRVWLGTTFLSEFDLVEIGDDATIGDKTSLQTHLFEDRVMKMSVVKIGSASSIGSRSVVLYDAEVGEAASLNALSLVMKGETLPPGSHWEGIPARASKG